MEHFQLHFLTLIMKLESLSNKKYRTISFDQKCKNPEKNTNKSYTERYLKNVITKELYSKKDMEACFSIRSCINFLGNLCRF